MKLTYEQKVQIYHDWKSNRMSATELAEHYHIALSNIKYLVELNIPLNLCHPVRFELCQQIRLFSASLSGENCAIFKSTGDRSCGFFC